jgi:hypothetical protein
MIIGVVERNAAKTLSFSIWTSELTTDVMKEMGRALVW